MRPGSHGHAAVVGARGFLGRALVQGLRAADVRVEELGRHRPAVTDGTPDAALASVDTVFWAASSINPALAADDPGRVARDRAAFVDLLEALPTGPRVVLLSSGGTVYGDGASAPFHEDAPLAPTSVYGRAKAELEELLVASGRSGTRVRIANAYGPGQQPAPGQGVIGHWLRAVAHGRPVTVFGPLSTVRDYVYVDDVVDALVRVHLGGGGTPACVNVGSGTPTTLGDVLDAVRAAVGGSPVAVDQRPARPFDVPVSWLDTTRARRELGWVPRTGLSDGVAAMWRWVRP